MVGLCSSHTCPNLTSAPRDLRRHLCSSEDRAELKQLLGRRPVRGFVQEHQSYGLPWGLYTCPHSPSNSTMGGP